MRKHLVEYATQLFTLTGQSPQQAADSAQTVLRIETALAKASMDRTARRDPKNRDHKMTRDRGRSLAPNFYLDRYFAAMGTPNFPSLNVSNPEFFKQVNGVLESESLEALQDLRDAGTCWTAVPPWLSKPFVDANFKMQTGADRAGRNQAALEALREFHRWRTGRGAGPALRRADFRRRRQTAHVEDGGRAGKSARSGHQNPALDDGRNQEAGQGQSWTPSATRSVIPTCGATTVRSRSCAAICWAISCGPTNLKLGRQIAKIGKPVDRNEWGMTPPTVNAYYSRLAERDRVSRGHSAAAVLRQEAG